mgnify:CR=1 FL=1
MSIEQLPLDTVPDHDLVGALEAVLLVVEVRLLESGLEEIFLRLTGENAARNLIDVLDA